MIERPMIETPLMESPMEGRVLPRVNHGRCPQLSLLMSQSGVGESTPSLTGYIFCIPFP